SAQNVSSENNGAFTGEISVNMLSDLNCKYVILGHSEIRKNLLEDSKLINKKAELVIKNNIIPIICISEKEQILEINKNILESEIIIAYEPLSAIGTGKISSLENISENINFIKSKLNNKKSRIIYGGSVNSKNCLEFSKIDNLNGFLIGGASLEVDSLLEIVDFIKK
ncbi:MAG: triose-phosphate isomerase family protein, partial [Candidatus Gracilibacteria bacterium]|nr:triose-phosphate isomerase family protein [Candidatus Gracilibacteria bacterium]